MSEQDAETVTLVLTREDATCLLELTEKSIGHLDKWLDMRDVDDPAPRLTRERAVYVELAAQLRASK